MDPDQKSYKDLWEATLTNLLLYTDEEKHEWLSRVGMNLLSNPDFLFHEEPWYWICIPVARHFKIGPIEDPPRTAEARVFFILATAMRGILPQNVDWATLRTLLTEIGTKPEGSAGG